MAQRTVVTLVDDLDGGVAAESVSFGLDHVDYEIDLSGEHAEALREVLAPYVAAARRTGGRRLARTATAVRSTSSSGPSAGAGRSRSANAEIRAWAAEHGVTLAERGRLPGRVVEAYEARDPTMLPSADSAASPAAGEPASPPETTPDAAPSPSSEDGERRGRDGLTGAERETIRGWAAEQGIDVKPRGQLKKDLISNYRAWEARR